MSKLVQRTEHQSNVSEHSQVSQKSIQAKKGSIQAKKQPIQAKQRPIQSKQRPIQRKKSPIQTKQQPIQRTTNGPSRSSEIAKAMGTQYGVDTSPLQFNHNSSFPDKVNAEATIQGNKIDFAPGKDSDHTIKHEIGHYIDNTLNGTPTGNATVQGQRIDTTREQAADKIADTPLQRKQEPEETVASQPPQHDVVQRVEKKDIKEGMYLKLEDFMGTEFFVVLEVREKGVFIRALSSEGKPYEIAYDRIKDWEISSENEFKENNKGEEESKLKEDEFASRVEKKGGSFDLYMDMLNYFAPGNFVITGSKAMQLWGKRLGVDTREPEDLDVLISESVFEKVGSSMSAIITGRHDTSKNLALQPAKGGIKIDMTTEGGSKGKISDAVYMDGIPVLPVKALLRSKQASGAKADDIKKLKEMQRKQGNKH